MDTWATSSVSPLINAHWKEEGDITEKLLPMGMRTQAHEIIRTWAFYTIAKTWFHLETIPLKDIMICGFVLAKKGEKISKSKGNSNLEPKTLIETRSADAIRYWAASAKLGTDTTFAEDELSISNRFITKLWNASKFSLMHMGDFNPKTGTILLAQDKWILEKLNDTVKKAKKYLDSYEIGLARNVIDDFFWKDYCDNYLELVKDRLYKPEVHGVQEQQSGLCAIYTTLLNILKLYSIFTPFITEKIYKSFFEQFEGCNSISQLTWIDGKPEETGYLEFGECIKEILMTVRKYKSENSLSMKDEIQELTLTLSPENAAFMKEAFNDMQAATHGVKIVVLEGAETGVLIGNEG